jgi:hypothetical protein
MTKWEIFHHTYTFFMASFGLIIWIWDFSFLT